MNTENILVDIDQLFDSMLTRAIDFLPKLILATFILVFGLLVAYLLKNLSKRLILYLDKQLNDNLRDRFLKVDLRSSAVVVGKTIFWSIVLFVIAIDTQIFGFSILNTWFNGLLLYLPNIVAGIVIIIVGIVTGRLVSDLVATAAVRTGLSNGAYLGRLVRSIILFVSIVIAVGQVGIEITFLTNLVTIIIGILLTGAAIAFGLGARTSVSNILGAYYLQKTYAEGYHVKIGELEGVIIKITATSVIVKTDDGEVSIPAKDFSEKETTLISRN